ncbi:Cd(II)/Pb(II)-responsive transcriptional regulator [Marinobacter sp. X15-166B]|uniref:Cd(II)/Pb(II)-responsive transcriptional regulator n=1 Tax=Marinobacter sp. X15-166B TaxID=1897620 RepID=UPI00085BEC3E|nr:Cd(II)/Pb(II)-responsive transcriptional regulator [Marinobacter sp. X15-166B]OEY65496.1 Cd(II)/Pb(II)-responsive transcriptional regulator [Marinobacter sp. X15-166B]
MRIGALAKQVGITVETIRYYEQAGLLHRPARDPSNNYRLYDPGHLERLQFIRRCRILAMTHAEIQALLRARTQPDHSCDTINELIDEHLQHVQTRIAELQALERELSTLRQQCGASRPARECGILRELDNPENLDLGATASAGPGAGCHPEVHPPYPEVDDRA